MQNDQCLELQEMIVTEWSKMRHVLHAHAEGVITTSHDIEHCVAYYIVRVKMQYNNTALSCCY